VRVHRARGSRRTVVITAGEGRLDLKVGPESIKRALWVLDGFIKSFEDARLRVSVKDSSTLVQQTVRLHMVHDQSNRRNGNKGRLLARAQHQPARNDEARHRSTAGAFIDPH